MTQQDRQKILNHLRVYNYSTLTVDSVYAQIKKSVRKATYKNSDVFVEINAGSTQSFAIRVHAINTRNFNVA